jgi:hypothetical protein
MSKTKNDVVIPAGKLWPKTPSGGDLQIEVFGATGEYKSGKTLLGLSIAPGKHPQGHQHAGQPRTLYLDFEKSGGTYGGTGCRRIDVPATMMAEGIDYAPLKVFEYFLKTVNGLQPGQYDVIVADPVTDIESGLVEYVKRNCRQFGLSENQVQKGGGILWGAVKDYWKQVLLKLSTRCQCFYFTSHLRDVWQGNAPTGKREPKGKETLMELASLYLWLERKPNDKGEVSDAPSAIVLKQRLADTFMDDAGALRVVPLMPPRIPVATVAAIRQYIANPPDYQKLATGERVIEAKTTEEDLERLKLQRAEAERATEETRLERMRRIEEYQAGQRKATETQPPAADQTAQRQNDAEARRKQEAKAAAETAEIERLKAEAEAKLAEAKATEERLIAGHDQWRPGKETQEAQSAGSSSGNGNGASNGTATVPGDFCTRAQALEIAELFRELQLDREKILAILAKAKVEKIGQLKRSDALLLAEKLKAALARKSNGNGSANGNP